MGKYTAIDDPSAHFQALVYAGTGGDAGASQPTTHTNTGNSDLQPDFIWFKDRGASYQHYLVDSSRGRAKGLHSDDASAETTTGSTSYDLVSFDSDGFKVGLPSEGNSTNGGTTSKVAWQWKANGGTTASNTTGNGIDSVVQANTTAGFSIVTYDGNGTQTGQTVGHGLGAVPKMIISKDRDATSNVPNWRVYHQAIGNTKYLTLDTAAAAGTYNDWDNTTPTSSVYSVGGAGGYTPTNTNNTEYIAYVFADVQGFSKMGSYVGNGDATNGPYIHLGFAPAWVMIKNSETANRPWYMFDNKRRAFNPNGSMLEADTSDAEATDQAIDMLSNGFKVRPDALGSFGTSSLNHSGQKMVYAAFAENPFVTSGGIPTTAR